MESWGVPSWHPVTVWGFMCDLLIAPFAIPLIDAYGWIQAKRRKSA